MKCMALENRLKEKDAWDIYYCIRYYPGGIETLIKDFELLANHSQMREAMEILTHKFSSPDAMGPKYVADFEEIMDPEERMIRQRDAYERVNHLCQSIKF